MFLKKLSTSVLSALLIVGLFLSQFAIVNKVIDAKKTKTAKSSKTDKESKVEFTQFNPQVVSPTHDFSFESFIPIFGQNLFLKSFEFIKIGNPANFSFYNSYSAKIFEHIIATNAP